MSERYFRDASGGIRIVGDGTRPEELGIDTRSALEVPRLPEPYERWVGPRRGWVVSKAVKVRCERDAQLRDPNHVAALEERLARIEALLGAASGPEEGAP